MIFRDFAARLAGSRVKLLLLPHLIQKYADGTYHGAPPASERELGRIIGVSHVAVNKAFKDFFDLNLVNPRKMGNVNIWDAIEQSYAFKVLATVPLIEATRASPIEKLKQLISEKLSDITGVDKVVIYGSVASATEGTFSDIDLLIVIKEKRVKEKLEVRLDELEKRCSALFGNLLSPHFVVSGASQPAWVSSAIDKGIRVL